MNPILISLLLLAEGALFAWTMNRRLRPIFNGRVDVRWDDLGERTKRLLTFGFGQKRMVDPGERGSGIAHILVFGAFIVLAIRTITLVGMGFSRSFHLPGFGPGQPLHVPYELLKETVVLGALVGVAIFLYYRLVKPKERLTLSMEGWIILLVIASLMITELMFEGGAIARGIAAGATPDWYTYAANGVARGFLAVGLGDGALSAISGFGYWSHVFILLSFGNFLPYGKHFHIITGLPTVFFQRTSPVGQLSKPDLENATQFGAAKLTDLSWKELLDTYSCTECGRCQTHCPTYVTGKPLSHKEVNRAIRHHMQDVAPDMPLPIAAFLAKARGQNPATSNESTDANAPQAEGAATAAMPELRNIVGDDGIIPAETIWACTTCGWCETACPVFIENIPRIVDFRRNKVLMEGDMPEEAQRVFNGMEQQSNPWGVGSNKRADWTEGLDVPVAANLAEAGNKFEYLFFVGCAGSFDDRQKKVTKSIFRILKEGGVDFAILGTEEGCTGDSARRLGNEYLFQQLAQANVEVMQKYGVTKVITQCPHCFNTIGNEYAQFGVKFDVIHHSQLIENLIASGKITLAKEVHDTVTFHDSCYLARYNGIVEAPRNVLKKVPMLKVIEMPRSGKQGFCCGAGGGRMWLEEKLGSRINQNRVEEAAGTGAGVVATGCPFCLTMIRDGINETGREEKMAARDLAEIVAESMAETKPAEKPAETVTA